MDERDDNALLDAVGRRQDQEAFSALFARYQKPAFNLACYLTRNRELAEEAVQDALWDIWRTAASYRPGNARGWIMRIVANKSIQWSRTDRREHGAMKERSAPEPVALSSGEAAEQAEVLAALRQMLEDLSGGDRHLVALYFGAGLSHEEIAGELSMPRPTVSYKLGKILDALRANLGKAGYAAAAPWVDARGLTEALTSGQEAPMDLGARVLKGLGRVPRQSLRAGPAAGRGFSGKAAYGMAVLLAAMGATGVWWALSRPATPGQASAADRKERVPEAASVPLSPPAETPPFFMRWTFEHGRPADFRVIQKGWSWLPGQGGRPARLAADQKSLAGMWLLPQIPPQPFYIQLTGVTISGTGRATCDLIWTAGQKLLPSRCWSRPQKMVVGDGFSTLRIVAREQFVVNYLGADPWTLYEYAAPYPGGRVALFVQNHAFEALELGALGKEASGPDFEQLKAQMARWGVEPKTLPGQPFQVLPEEGVPPSASGAAEK